MILIGAPPPGGGGWEGADHLGNIRSVITTDPEHHFIAQGTDYYPFGLEIYIYGYSDYNQLKYNAKELQTEADLTWYDYGARFYDPQLGRWHSVDPMAEERSRTSPFCYVQNNPTNRTDLFGMLDTKYEDELGNTLLETNDGSDAVVTVTDDKRAGFDASVKGTENTDDPTWNNTMKKYLVGFELLEQQEGVLSMLNSDWSKKNAIEYWQNPTAGNAFSFAFSEALSQWTNPELVVMGLSVGVAGMGGVERISTANVAKSNTQGYKSFSAFKRAMGPAGEGQAWHHIVEQNSANIANFGPEVIHNTTNVIRLPNGAGSIHAKVTGHYNSLMPGTSMRVRDYINTLSYQQQNQYGLDVLKRFER